MNFDPTLTENFVISLRGGDIPLALEWAERAVTHSLALSQISVEPEKSYNDIELADELTRLLNSVPGASSDLTWQVTLPTIIGLLKQFVNKHVEASDGITDSESEQEGS